MMQKKYLTDIQVLLCEKGGALVEPVYFEGFDHIDKYQDHNATILKTLPIIPELINPEIVDYFKRHPIGYKRKKKRKSAKRKPTKRKPTKRKSTKRRSKQRKYKKTKRRR